MAVAEAVAEAVAVDWTTMATYYGEEKYSGGRFFSPHSRSTSVEFLPAGVQQPAPRERMSAVLLDPKRTALHDISNKGASLLGVDKARRRRRPRVCPPPLHLPHPPQRVPQPHQRAG